ncbi:MAG TPA: hypothetical protein VGK67_25630 [Myxococcales bacterium]|jgi:hypothetical protein
MELRLLLAATALALPLVLPAPARAADLAMTAEEFGLWRDYQGALTDARVQKMPEKQRLPAIAKNFKTTEKRLKEAVEKGEKDGEAVAKQAEELTKTALQGTDIASRLKEVKLDTSASHVVAYVTWVAASAETIDKEVCLVATKVIKENPLASTVKVDVLDSIDDKKKLFDALIGRSNAAKIQEDKIVDFASTRYIKLFEKVKRAE